MPSDILTQFAKLESSGALNEIKAEFELKETLGNGAFAVVKRAIPKVPKDYDKPVDPNIGVAIKFIVKAKLHDKVLLAREIEILGRITDHPGICTLFEVWELPEFICLVQQFITGNGLESTLLPNEDTPIPLEEKKCAEIIAQVLIGIQFVHKLKIAHRDLKPDNVMYDPKRNFKIGNSLKECEFNACIIDFGLGKIFGESENLSTARGTPFYVAPEVVQGSHMYGEECDLWSLGVLMYWLVNNNHALPFNGDDLPDLLGNIRSGQFEFYPDEFEGTSNEAMDLIKQLLVIDVSKRISASNALKHPWFKKMGIEGLEKLEKFNLDPSSFESSSNKETKSNDNNNNNNSNNNSNNKDAPSSPKSPKKEKKLTKFVLKLLNIKDK